MQTVSRESLFELHDGVVSDRPKASSMSNAGVASYGAWHPVEFYMHRVVSRPPLLPLLKLRTAPWQVGCFPNGSCSNVEHCHRHRVGGHARDCDGGACRPKMLGSGRARRYKIGRPLWSMPFCCHDGRPAGAIRLDTFGHATGRGGNSTRWLAFRQSTHISFTM